jgi:lipoyl(octanoyl) transferase
MRRCEVQDLGRLDYDKAYTLQTELLDLRKKGEIPDQLLFVEHPHVITVGRNAEMSHLLVSHEVLRKAGVALVETNRGGDITYHGPGQIVSYPIMDLKEWKRDVVAYVRALEQAIINALGSFGVTASRLAGATGVWVEGAKVAAIGVHISRWVTCHGFALNHTTDLSYFQFIVPCGLTKPVTSLHAIGCAATRDEVQAALTYELGRQFGLEMVQPVTFETSGELLHERVK